MVSDGKGNILARTFLVLTSVESPEATLKTIGVLVKDCIISGVLIVQKQVVVVVAEGPSEEVFDLIESLSDYDDVKVLVFVEDCPKRLFSCFGSTILAPSKGSGVNLGDVDITAFVFELYSNLLSIGMKSKCRSDFKDDVMKAKQKYPDLVPAYERVLALTQSNLVLSFTEFNQVFNKPMGRTSLEDKIWPGNNLSEDLGIKM